jgi:hypothetical protein
MNNWLSKLAFILLASFTLSEVSIANIGANAGASSSWKFRVMLDDRPIGYHRVKINREQNRKSVHTQANFDVRILFIPVYSYEHETRERWVDNCLVDVSSTTDDNGEDYFINSMQQKQQLVVETRDGTTSLEGCVRTFAYWDVDLLKSDRLLNTQTGEYEDVDITDMGTGVLSFAEKEIEARHFRLVCENMTIDLWYTQDMHWLALESVTDSGAVLRYLPETLPAEVTGAQS